MASRAKHAQRSHKTYSNNYSVYRGFAIKASQSKEYKDFNKTLSETFANFFGGLFKRHQSK